MNEDDANISHVRRWGLKSMYVELDRIYMRIDSLLNEQQLLKDGVSDDDVSVVLLESRDVIGEVLRSLHLAGQAVEIYLKKDEANE
jgi:hypothetical protein